MVHFIDRPGKVSRHLVDVKTDLRTASRSGQTVSDFVETECKGIFHRRIVQDRGVPDCNRDVRPLCLQVPDKEPVKYDLTAIVRKVHDTGTTFQDFISIVTIEPFCKFCCKEPGKIGCDIMIFYCIVECVSNYARKDMIPESVEIPPDGLADCLRFGISRPFQIPEGVPVSNYPAGLPVYGTRNLRVEEF